MSTDGGGDAVNDVPAPSGDPAARRAYNRPRRYPVQAPAAQAPAAPETEAPAAAAPAPEVTRQNPSLAEAADSWGRRDADGGGANGGGANGVGALGGGAGPVPPGVPGAPPAGAPAPYPAGYPRDPGPSGPSGYPPAGTPEAGTLDRPRTPTTRTLVLIGAAVVVLALVVGLIVGLSGSDDSTKPQGAAPLTATASTLSGSTASTTAPGGTPTSAASSPAGGAPPVATEVCATLGSTAPLTNFVAQPRPGERMPQTYVEPQSGTKVAVCVGFFRPGAGGGRGRIAYLAEYERLAATQYALTLKTLGWVLVPTLPRATYRNNLGTTVTLVQQGTSLVTVVGTGR